MRFHHLPNPKHRRALYERWTLILSFLILGLVGIAYQLQERNLVADQLVTSGLPVGAVLIGASVVGILVSLIVFRTPHDGQSEL